MACLFCQIASGAIPASVIYRDDDVTAFRDINPQAPIHVLIIPNHHVELIADFGTDEAVLLGRLIEVANQLARQEGIGETGYRLVTNRGPDAGQTVAHLHWHLLGGRKMSWPPG